MFLTIFRLITLWNIYLVSATPDGIGMYSLVCSSTAIPHILTQCFCQRVVKTIPNLNVLVLQAIFKTEGIFHILCLFFYCCKIHMKFQLRLLHFACG